jgi:hypothetical protein
VVVIDVGLCLFALQLVEVVFEFVLELVGLVLMLVF